MDLLNNLVEQYPWLGGLAMLMGSLRLIMKPLFTVIDKYVESTPETSDNEKWESFKSSKTVKYLAWFMDYIASVKLNTESKPKSEGRT